MRGLYNFIIVIIATTFYGAGAMLTSLLPGGSESFIRWAQAWAKIITSWCGVNVRGVFPPPGSGLDWSRPYVYMANHQSHYDIPCIYSVVPAPLRFLTKKELRWIPFLGWSIWIAGYVFIDRKKREDAFASIARAAEDFTRKGHAITVFPEGTRTRDGKLQPFKKGGFHLALEAGAQVVPIGITGTFHVLPRGSMNVRPGEVTVRVGVPIDTSKYRRNNREDLAALQAEVRTAIESLLREES